MAGISEELRQAVLQAAIQGKLTRKLSADGNVQDLLEKIKTEKEHLIIEKKIPKEKNSKPINEDEQLISIPEHWLYVRVQDIASYITDYVANGSFATLKKHTNVYDTPNYAIFVRTVDLSANFQNTLSYIDQESYNFLQKSALYGGELILPNIGGSIGKTFLMPDLGCPMSLAPNSIMVKFMLPIMNVYFSYIIRSPYGQKFLIKTKGGTATPKFSKTELRNMVVPLPPLDELERIVTRVEEIMEKIDELEKIEKELTALRTAFPGDMKAALIQAAMQGKLTEPLPEDGNAGDLLAKIKEEKETLVKEKKIKKEKSLKPIIEDEIPFEIPKNWKWCRWGTLSYSIQYGVNSPALQTGNAKMVRISDIQNNTIVWESVPYCDIKDSDIETYQLSNKDILFARTGGTVGKTVIVKNMPMDIPYVYAGYLIRTNYYENLLPQYLKYFMESELYWNQLRNGTTKNAQPNCNGQTLSAMIIPIPPLAEQQRIVEKLDKLLPLCESLENNL